MEDKQNKGIGIAGTILFHAVLIGLLVFYGFSKVEQQDEEGILVMVGVADGAEAGAPSQVQPEPQPVKPEPQPQPEPVPAKPSAAPEVKEEVVTQDNEESLKLAEADKKAREEKERLRKEEEKRKKEEAEKRRLEEEKRKKEEAIRNKVSNVFQNSSQTASQGSSESATPAKGNPFGNSDTGAQSGSPGYGTYDLGGRGIMGSLPKPSISVNESGNVVIAITVDESGKVTAAVLGKGTTTTSTQLRERALAAAKKAVFEAKSGTISQSGTITYRFDSDN